jgi:hypothetical protein
MEVLGTSLIRNTLVGVLIDRHAKGHVHRKELINNNNNNNNNNDHRAGRGIGSAAKRHRLIWPEERERETNPRTLSRAVRDSVDKYVSQWDRTRLAAEA